MDLATTYSNKKDQVNDLSKADGLPAEAGVGGNVTDSVEEYVRYNKGVAHSGQT